MHNSYNPQRSQSPAASSRNPTPNRPLTPSQMLQYAPRSMSPSMHYPNYAPQYPEQVQDMSYQHYQQVAGSSVPRYSSGSPVPHHRPSHSRHTSDAAGAYAPALYGATSDPQQFFPTPAQTVQSHYANPGLRPAPLSSPSPLNPRHPPPAAHTAHYLPATPPPHVPASQSYPHLHASGSHDAGPASPPPVGDRYVCTQCGASFSRSHDRKRHWASQHATSPSLHRCRVCNKEFSRADSLKRHTDHGCTGATI
ncbi:hypothetical protein HWV62_8957 [Athelia sp. TMB]|nr:hypothetical protein HWV62_8957 [Athelia sp. TMB]